MDRPHSCLGLWHPNLCLLQVIAGTPKHITEPQAELEIHEYGKHTQERGAPYTNTTQSSTPGCAQDHWIVMLQHWGQQNQVMGCCLSSVTEKHHPKQNTCPHTSCLTDHAVQRLMLASIHSGSSDLIAPVHMMPSLPAACCKSKCCACWSDEQFWNLISMSGQHNISSAQCNTAQVNL